MTTVSETPSSGQVREQLVKHMPLFRHLARRRVREQDVEDVVHDAVLTALEKQTEGVNVRAWVARILHFTILSRRSRWREQSGEAVDVAGQSSVEEVIAAREQLRLIERLPPACQALLLQAGLDDERPPRRTAGRLQRARRRFRKLACTSCPDTNP